MAELNNTTQTQEPVYLNYGADQIDQQAFLDAAANNVQQYVNNQTWSAKRKQKFLNAYSDIMSKGIIGANNKTGQWAVDLNSNIDLESMDRKDQEMYHEAAYYILQQMKGITPKAKEEEKKKSDLPAFNNDYFTEQFQGYIGNQLFGGRNWDRNTDWNVLDEADKYGIRGTDNRAEKLASMLEGYRDSLKEEDLNFEGSPFTDLNDFKTKVNNAIDQLRNKTWNQGDIDALNQIGINPETYMSTGANDTVTVGDQTMTRQQAKEFYEKQEADKLAAEQKNAQTKALAQQQANAGVLTPINGINAVEAINQAPAYAEYLGRTYGVGQQGFNAINTAIQGLIEKGYNNGKGGGLTNAEKKQLGNLLYYVRQNNPNYQKSNLSDQDWAELNLHKNLGSTNRAGYVRLPWQTSDGRYTYADDKGNVYFLKPQNKAKIAGPAFNRSTAYNDYKNNFLKSQLQLNNEKPVLSQDTDILISDMTSMLGDIVSLGGGYAGAAGGITTLLSDLYGDIRRGKDTWSTIKNLGANVAWGAAGLIPGAKLGKLAKNAARIYATLQSAGILMNDEVQQSWKNLIAGKPITARDFENFKWTLHAITGGTNAVRGHFTERNVAKQIKSNTKPTIETKAGAKPITQEQVNKINKVGGRKGQKEAEKAFEKTIGAQAKEGTFNFQEEPRAWYNPARYSQRLRNWISDDERLILPKTAQSVNTQAVNRLLEMDKAKPIIGIGNPLNKRFWTEGGPNRGGLSFYLKSYNNSTETSSEGSSKGSSEGGSKTIKYPYSTNGKGSYQGIRPVYESKNYSPKGVKRDYANTIERQNFTKNKVQSGKYKLAEDDVEVRESSGRFSIRVNGKVIGSNLEQQKVKELVSIIMKENKQAANKAKSKAYRVSTKDIGKYLRDLKKMGWLKQGGQINNFDLDKTISEFLNKQK